MNKTIKQLADELGVSKTAIRKYMSEEFRQEHTETDRNGVITITQSGCKLIAEIIGNNRKPIAETNENTVPDVLTIPREVWEALQRELDSKNKTIADLTAALKEEQLNVKSAQTLHAGTMGRQMLGAPKKHKWQFWKKDEGQHES